MGLPRHRAMMVLLAGAAASAMAGLLAGQALTPRLWDPAVLAPDFYAAYDGRTSASSDGAGWTAYDGSPPDYVIGTDWRLTAYREAQAYEAGPTDPDPIEPPPPVEAQPYRTARFEELPIEEPVFPSRDGDILSGLGAPAPPPPDDGAFPGA